MDAKDVENLQPEEPDWRDWYLFMCEATITVTHWEWTKDTVVKDRTARSTVVVQREELEDARFDLRREVEQRACSEVVDFVRSEGYRLGSSLRPTVEWFVWHHKHWFHWEWPEVQPHRTVQEMMAEVMAAAERPRADLVEESKGAEDD